MVKDKKAVLKGSLVNFMKKEEKSEPKAEKKIEVKKGEESIKKYKNLMKK